MGGSDNEDENAVIPVLDLLRDTVKEISGLMERATPKVLIENSYNSDKTVPLGHLRLRITEMVYLLIKLKKQ